MNFKDFMQKNLKEVSIWFMIGIVGWMVLLMKMPLWQKGLVIAVLIYGAFEMIGQMKGKKSLSGKFRAQMNKGLKEARKSIQEAQKEQEKASKAYVMPSGFAYARNKEFKGFGGMN